MRCLATSVLGARLQHSEGGSNLQLTGNGRFGLESRRFVDAFDGWDMKRVPCMVLIAISARFYISFSPYFKLSHATSMRSSKENASIVRGYARKENVKLPHCEFPEYADPVVMNLIGYRCRKG